MHLRPISSVGPPLSGGRESRGWPNICLCPEPGGTGAQRASVAPFSSPWGVFVPDFMLSERQHVFLRGAVRGIKGPEWGHIKRDGHEKLVKCITKPTH